MTRRTTTRYTKVRHEEAECDPPKVILQPLRKPETEIGQGLDELEAMLG